MARAKAGELRKLRMKKVQNRPCKETEDACSGSEEQIKSVKS